MPKDRAIESKAWENYWKMREEGGTAEIEFLVEEVREKLLPMLK